MYTAGPVPIRFATDPTPFAKPSARLIAPTRTMHANAIAHAVARVRRVRRVARRRTGLDMPAAEPVSHNKRSMPLVADWSRSGHFLHDPPVLSNPQ